MFMLTPSEVVPDCYTMAATDAASDGSSTQLLKNIWESASVLDSWETVFPKAKAAVAMFGHDIDDAEAEAHVKHFYQTMRHGLSFDWMLNYVCCKLLNVFPFSRAFEFKGTEPFVDSFADDKVFQEELFEINKELDALYNWAFEGYPDRMVYARLALIDGSNVGNAMYELSVNPKAGDGSPYVIPVATASRINYIHLLQEMLMQSVGFAKRGHWHEFFAKIKADEYNGILVVGNKFEAFAYGKFIGEEAASWHRLNNGIKMMGYSERQQRSEYIRAFADEMTFFRFQNDTLYVDETLFPQISFDDGETWLTGNTLKEAVTGQIDKALKMKIRYPFAPRYEDIGQKTIKLKGSLNCIIKDATVVLDENNEASTQIVFRGAKVSFKISDADKKYPFTFFATSSISIDSLTWLE